MLVLSVIATGLTLFYSCYGFWRDYFEMIVTAKRFRKLALKESAESNGFTKFGLDNRCLPEEISRETLTNSKSITSWVDSSKVYHL